VVDFIADNDTDGVDRSILMSVDVCLTQKEVLNYVGQATYVLMVHQLTVQGREAVWRLVPGLEMYGEEERSVMAPRKQILIPIGVGRQPVNPAIIVGKVQVRGIADDEVDNSDGHN